MSKVLELETPSGPGRIELDPGDGLVLLTHGAGGGVHSPDVDAVRDALMARGVGVGLVTQPYRVAGRRAPPQPAVQDAAWAALLGALRSRLETADGTLVLGGRSNGARVACRTAREVGASAVIALAFPLHPPGRPEKSRIAELDGAGVPVLVVQGERDPFGRPQPAPDRRVIVVAGDHALKRDLARTAQAVVDFVVTHIRDHDHRPGGARPGVAG